MCWLLGVDADFVDKQIGSARTQFSALFSTVLWAFTSGLQFVLVSWYRSSPVFFLPPGWFPPALVWLLGFPSAPYGEYVAICLTGTILLRPTTGS